MSENEAQVTPAGKIAEILSGLKDRVEEAKSVYERAQQEYRDALAVLKPSKPARKPRAKKQPPAAPPADDMPLPPGIVRYRSGYRVEGSKITHATVEAAVAAQQQ